MSVAGFLFKNKFYLKHDEMNIKEGDPSSMIIYVETNQHGWCDIIDDDGNCYLARTSKTYDEDGETLGPYEVFYKNNWVPIDTIAKTLKTLAYINYRNQLINQP